MKFLVPMTKGLLERGWIPDPFIRFGMRQLLRQKLIEECRDARSCVSTNDRKMNLISEMRSSPIAVNTKDANEQHYELPTKFFQLCLGDNLKYSSCYYKTGEETLSQAEEIMLELTCERAELQDGQHVLELGCGWGSLSLFMAAKYPKSKITGVSNSKTQKAFIEEQAKIRGLNNLKIITCDMNDFTIIESFDRIVSVEMFEHMRNWQILLARISGFLNPQGKLFIHIFTHQKYAYLYDAKDDSDFIGRYFFTGGIMPSHDLLLYFQDHFKIEDNWKVSGTHYSQTSEQWLSNMDSNKSQIMPILKSVYGKEALKWWHYWRIFYMACAELWGYDEGNEWIVSHYRFSKR